MNKTAIKNFAIWARNKLIADISYRAGLMGITADRIYTALPQSTGQTEFYDIGTAEPYAITGEAIQGIYDHELKRTVGAVPDHLLKLRAVIVGAGHGVIGIHLHNAVSVGFGILPASLNLLLDADVPLAAGGVPGVDHGQIPLRFGIFFHNSFPKQSYFITLKVNCLSV